MHIPILLETKKAGDFFVGDDRNIIYSETNLVRIGVEKTLDVAGGKTAAKHKEWSDFVIRHYHEEETHFLSLPLNMLRSVIL